MSLFAMSFMGLMPISSLVFGPIAKAVGPAYAIMGGSVVLGAWALVYRHGNPHFVGFVAVGALVLAAAQAAGES